MDWPTIIEQQRRALAGVLAGLVAMAAGLGGGPTLPRHLRLAVLRLLRPAESAVRRLVILTARRLTPPPLAPLSPVAKPACRGQFTFFRQRQGWVQGAIPRKESKLSPTPTRVPAFRLLDPLPRFRLRRQPVRIGIPRISVPGFTVPLPIVPLHRDDPVDASRLGRRLAALGEALDDLPGQARRFARWEARNRAARSVGKIRRVGPLRPGRPPGLPARLSRRRAHAAHDILRKLNDYAVYALERRDTS